MIQLGRILGGSERARPTAHHWRPRGIGAAVACLLLHGAVATHAGPVTASGDNTAGSDWQLAIGPLIGATALDQSLANYRWDTRPALQSGVQATLYRGRFGAGVRVLRSQTTQGSGILGATEAPQVNLTSFDIIGEARVVRYLGAELWGTAHTGLLHLGYDPDQIVFDPGAGGPITVAYDPISEWDFGLGLEVRRELMTHMALSLQAEGSTFALDTARRRGNEIVQSRERFYGWSLRLQVSWLLNLG